MAIPEIVDERLRLTAELMRYRNDLIAKAYGAIGRGESLLRTARELRRVKVAEDWKEYARGIYLAAVSFARRAKRAVRRKKGDVYLPLILFAKRDNPAAKISRKAIYPQMRKFEERAKEEEIRKWLNEAKNAKGMGAPGTFFLLSWHGDSAEDHAPYQGRVYYAEGWERAIADPGDRAKVALSIARKGIHLKMPREHASPELARMVAKDRLLLEKWRSYLRTRFGGA